MSNDSFSIGVVGPCAAGKTTLIDGLVRQGFHAKHIAQEHSYVQDMWQTFSNPNVLIYLDVSYTTSLSRRKLNWTEREFDTQKQRLKHAKVNADKYINTDHLTPADILEICLSFLDEIKNNNQSKEG